jgi:hypothetical protein
LTYEQTSGSWAQETSVRKRRQHSGSRLVGLVLDPAEAAARRMLYGDANDGGSASASAADGVRPNRECDRHRVDPHTALMLDLEASCRNRGRRVASGMAPAECARPEHPVYNPLAERDRRPFRGAPRATA